MPTEIKKYGQPDRETIENYVVGHLVRAVPEDNDTTGAELISSRAVHPSAFANLQTRELYIAALDYYRESGRRLCRQAYADMYTLTETPDERRCRGEHAMKCYSTTLTRRGHDLGVLLDVLRGFAERNAKVPAAPAPIAEPDAATVPEAPTEEEVVDLCRGTLYGVFIDESRKVGDVTPEFGVASALVTVTAGWMSSRVLVNGGRARAWAMLVGEQASGKGTCQEPLQRIVGPRTGLIPLASSKTYLRMLGHNPWGVYAIREFRAFMNGFLHDTLSNLNDSFDAFEVASASETSGMVRVRNSAPSMLAACQPDCFQKPEMAEFWASGFFSRCLIAYDGRPQPEFAPLPPMGKAHRMDHEAIDAAMGSFFDFMPPAMTPAAERVLVGTEDKKGKPKGSGVWEHPMPSLNWVSEPFSDLWRRCMMPKEMRPLMTRLTREYIPLLAVPFCEKHDLKRGVITSEAQKRAERLLLLFYWAAHRLMDCAPEDKSERLAMTILNYIQKRPGCTLPQIQGGVRYGDPRSFKAAMDSLVERGKLTFEEKKNKNGSTLCHNFRVVSNCKPEELPPLPKPKDYSPSEPTSINSRLSIHVPEPETFAF